MSTLPWGRDLLGFYFSIRLFFLNLTLFLWIQKVRPHLILTERFWLNIILFNFDHLIYEVLLCNVLPMERFPLARLLELFLHLDLDVSVVLH